MIMMLINLCIFFLIQINPNGMISVGKRYRRATPRSLASINRNILAVFWAATDFGRDSRVIYKTFSRGEELARVNERINECANLSGSFTGTWMLVVTWQKVSPFARFTRGFLWRRTTYNPYLDEVGISPHWPTLRKHVFSVRDRFPRVLLVWSIPVDTSSANAFTSDQCQTSPQPHHKYYTTQYEEPGFS